MAKSVVIQAYIPVGSIVGPFNLLSDADDYDIPFDTDVTVTELLSGYLATTVPDAATIVRIISTGNCGNYVNSLIAPANVCVGEVTLGAQLWTPCNLNVDTYSDKSEIPYASTAAEWQAADNQKIGAWCYQNNNPANDTLYGKLYNKYAVQGIWNAASLTDVTERKSLAPAGYHIPTMAEWQTLKNWVDTQYAPFDTRMTADKMKATTGWDFSGNGTNVTGFTANPGGNRNTSGTFTGAGSSAYFWSSSVVGDDSVVMTTGDELDFSIYNSDGDGLSVRLIKNV